MKFVSGSGVARHSLDYGEESDDELKQEDISFNEAGVGAPSLNLPLTPAGRSISLDPGALLAGTVSEKSPRIEASTCAALCNPPEGWTRGVW